MPSAFPALGRDVNTDYRTHPMDLLAQKLSLFAPLLVAKAQSRTGTSAGQSPRARERGVFMDLGILAAVAMLAVWAVGTFFFEAPGWLHILLTAGLFLLIWRITVRGTSPTKRADE